jgi:hypothetical protein
MDHHIFIRNDESPPDHCFGRKAGQGGGDAEITDRENAIDLVSSGDSHLMGGCHLQIQGWEQGNSRKRKGNPCKIPKMG